MEFFIVLWIIFAVIAGMIANDKGTSVGLYAFLGFILGPIGVILALFSKKTEG